MRREHLYLLRIWSDSDQEMAWRASLENLHTKEKLYFKDLEALRAFLCLTPGPQPAKPSAEDSER